MLTESRGDGERHQFSCDLQIQSRDVLAHPARAEPVKMQELPVGGLRRRADQGPGVFVVLWIEHPPSDS